MTLRLSRIFLVPLALLAVVILAGPALAQPAPGGLDPGVAAPDVPPSGEAPPADDGGGDGDADATPTLELDEPDEPSLIDRVTNPLATIADAFSRGAIWLFGQLLSWLEGTATLDLGTPWLTGMYGQVVSLSAWIAMFVFVAAMMRSVSGGETADRPLGRVIIVGVGLGIVLPFLSLLLQAADEMTLTLIQNARPGVEAMLRTMVLGLFASAGAGAPVIITIIFGFVMVILGLWIWLLLVVRTVALSILVVLIAIPMAMSIGGNASAIRRYRTWILGLIFLKPIVAAVFWIGAAPFDPAFGGLEQSGVVAGVTGVALLGVAAVAPWKAAQLFDTGFIQPAASMLQTMTPSGVTHKISHPMQTARHLAQSRERYIGWTRSSATRVGDVVGGSARRSVQSRAPVSVAASSGGGVAAGSGAATTGAATAATAGAALPVAAASVAAGSARRVLRRATQLPRAAGSIVHSTDSGTQIAVSPTGEARRTQVGVALPTYVSRSGVVSNGRPRAAPTEHEATRGDVVLLTPPRERPPLTRTSSPLAQQQQQPPRYGPPTPSAKKQMTRPRAEPLPPEPRPLPRRRNP